MSGDSPSKSSEEQTGPGPGASERMVTRYDPPSLQMGEFVCFCSESFEEQKVVACLTIKPLYRQQPAVTGAGLASASGSGREL